PRTIYKGTIHQSTQYRNNQIHSYSGTDDRPRTSKKRTTWWCATAVRRSERRLCCGPIVLLLRRVRRRIDSREFGAGLIYHKCVDLKISCLAMCLQKKALFQQRP